jgi:predicted ribosome quality control (RQC) complex YloA/Tae2 family protein
MRVVILCTALTVVLAATGCQSALYRAYETVGVEKRDLLVKRVSAAREAQTEARDQFSSALDQFRSMVAVDAGELEKTYDRLNAEYEQSAERAEEVKERVDAVEQVSEDLFAEWERELADYDNAALRRDSQRLLRDTRQRYTTLMKAMRRAESTMEPVLGAFNDQVLVLKHNLNARAIGSLRNELASIEKQTAELIEDMDRAIAEANSFIGSMQG